MAYNRKELAYEALRHLGALSDGEDATDEDYARVNDKIPAVQAMLRETDVYFLPDLENVPDEAFIPLSHYIAGACASSFGQHHDSNLIEWARWGREQLLILESEPPYYQPLEVQAY